MRFRTFFIMLGALIVAITFAFPLWQPLLQSAAGSTASLVPGLPEDLQAVFIALPADQQSAYRAIIAQNPDFAIAMLTASMQAPVPSPAEMSALPSLTGPVEVGSGSFERIDPLRWGQGDVTLFQQVDDSKLIWFENFSVANGPNLRVVLSASDAPLTTEALQQGDLDIDLGQLAGTVGNQYYEIPTGTDLSQYNSIAVYSPSINMIYTYAPLAMRS